MERKNKMKTKKKRILAIPFVLAVVSMTGCSGPDEKASTEEASFSESFFDEATSSEQSGEGTSSVTSSQEQSQIYYSVRFHLDEQVVEEKENIPDGSKISAPASSLTSGYDIHYWYSYVKGVKHPWSFSKDVLSSDLDLFADFDYATYSVSFMDKKGVLGPYSKEVTYKQKYDFSDVRGDSHRRVTDWKDSLGNSYGFEGVWTRKGGLTLYADWEAVRYQITYLLKGGENDEGNPASYTIEECPVELKPAKKDGFRFKYWTDQNGNEINTINEDCYGDLSLSPVWDKTYSLNLSSDTEGAGGVQTADGQTQYCYGEKVSVEAVPNEGYVFKGWYNGDENVSNSNPYTFSMPYQDSSLTAKFWTEERQNRHLLGIEPILYENYIYYGVYPSTRVSDEETLAALNSFGEEDANDKGWYLLDGAYYAKRARSSNPIYFHSVGIKFSDGLLVDWGVTYWFKVEAIKWGFIKWSDGGYFLTSIYALDNHCFDSGSTAPDSFLLSGLKDWLNGEFYNLAFSQGDSYILNPIIIPYEGDTTSRYGYSTDWAKVEGEEDYWIFDSLWNGLAPFYSPSSKSYGHCSRSENRNVVIPKMRISSYLES